MNALNMHHASMATLTKHTQKLCTIHIKRYHSILLHYFLPKTRFEIHHGLEHLLLGDKIKVQKET